MAVMPMRLGLLVLGLLLCHAFMQAQAETQPHAARAVIQEAREICRRDGGRHFRLEEGAIRSLDLNGDSRTDLLIDFRAATCVGRANAFCGTGGCDLAILVARPAHRWTIVFQGRVIRYELGPGPRTMTFRLHGSYCGKAGLDDCFQKQRITPEPFDFKEPH
jgi:hypothetical protein